MGKSLYRTYRSASFDEIVGQDHITTTLKNMLSSGDVPHAFIFSGPRGVGKTSIARLLAYAVNGHDYTLEASHLDIIEIDAASNRRIDEIREIKERVAIAPTSGKYKVYIIDEVHMLTKEAFNALLKTLEEPPAHVIFILATTELHKVPDTILSRCIQFTFRAIEPETLTKHLAQIAKKEKITVEKEALQLLAEHAHGSFRDALSLLEQVKYYGENVDVASAERMLGLSPRNIIEDIFSAVEVNDQKLLLHSLQSAYEHGAVVPTLCEQLTAEARHRLINNHGSVSRDELLNLQRELLAVPGSVKPSIALELCLLSKLKNIEITPSAQPTASSQPSVDVRQDKKPPTQKKNSDTQPKAVVDVVKQESTQPSGDYWRDFLDALKQKNNTLYGIARMAQIEHSDKKITLNFRFAFHKKQLDEAKNRATVTEIIQTTYGRDTVLEIAVNESVSSAATSSQSPKTEKKDVLSTVSNIFGGHEVLES